MFHDDAVSSAHGSDIQALRASSVPKNIRNPAPRGRSLSAYHPALAQTLRPEYAKVPRRKRPLGPEDSGADQQHLFVREGTGLACACSALRPEGDALDSHTKVVSNC